MLAIVVQRLGIGDPAADKGQAGLALEERQLLRLADPLGVGAAFEQAGGDQARDIVGVDRAVADAAFGGLDLDQGLQLVHAARAVADEGDGEALLGRLDGYGASHLVSADRNGGGVAWNVDLHARASSSRASSRAASMRPTRRSSSMAEGPEAQRPRQ